jgi:hypothetical protein
VLSRLFEALYLKVFVNIVIKRATCTVYIELLSKKNVIRSVEENFDTKFINEKMLAFISLYTNESPYYYISVLDNSTSQGAIPSCSKNQLGHYHDMTSSEYRCFKEKWTYFTSQSDLYTLEKHYKRIGLDFLFSPFVLLANFFKDKIDNHLAMFVLVEENYLSLAIFDNSELLFAKHLDVRNHKDEDAVLAYEEDSNDLNFDLDDGIDLDEITAMDELDTLDDFGNIEDLDSLEEIDEFSESKDLEEEFYQANLNVTEQKTSAGINEDYQRFLLIQSSVKRFYGDDKYDGRFIESVYIADGCGVSADLKGYLEEEMFLSVYVRKIDLAMQVCEMAKAELNA